MLQRNTTEPSSKAEMLAWAREQEALGMKRSAVAKQLNISRKTLWLWMKEDQKREEGAA